MNIRYASDVVGEPVVRIFGAFLIFIDVLFKRQGIFTINAYTSPNIKNTLKKQ